MNWFEKDGKELAELLHTKLLESEDGQLSKYEVWDIIDSKPYYGFRKTLYFTSKYIKEFNIEQNKDGSMNIIKKECCKMENQTHLNAVGEITELIYKATNKDEE